MTGRSRAFLAAVIIGGLAACGNGNRSAQPTTVAPPTSSTAQPATATISFATTAATAAAPTTTVAMTIAVTEPIALPSNPEADVRVALLGYFDLYFECLRTPADCDPATLTADQGPARGFLAKTTHDMVTGGLYDGVEDWGYAIVESLTFDSPTTARATVCAWDTSILYGPPGPDGNPTIMRNRPDTVRLNYVVYHENGVWRPGESTLVSKTPEVNECSPEA